MFGDVDDRVCWVVISDVGLWYVDGNCYMWRLSLVGVLLVLRFLFGSVCSNDGSNQCVLIVSVGVIRMIFQNVAFAGLLLII